MASRRPPYTIIEYLQKAFVLRMRISTPSGMAIPRSARHVRAFLGCCQQIANYVKHYSIMVSPLYNLTRKNVVFSNPWLEGTDYDVSFHRTKSAMLDEALWLWNIDLKKTVPGNRCFRSRMGGLCLSVRRHLRPKESF